MKKSVDWIKIPCHNIFNIILKILLKEQFMKFIKKVQCIIHSRLSSYIFFLLGVFAFINLKGASWAYEWIAELYPMGEKFVPIMLGIIAVSTGINFIYLFLSAFTEKQKKENKGTKAFNAAHTLFVAVSIITYIYTCVLVFGLDSGFSADKIQNGFSAIIPNLIFPALAGGMGLMLVFCQKGKNAVRALLCSITVSAVIISCTLIPGFQLGNNSSKSLPMPIIKSANLAEDAVIAFESLKKGEKPDAANMLQDNNKCWTAQDPGKMPAEGFENTNNSYAEIQLAKTAEINTAIIEETGNEAQYFRLQAYINNEWKTIYQSEKIQNARLCSFDSITTDKIRISIDKFRNQDTPVKIKSIKLFNEPKLDINNFEAAVYQRLDDDVPTEILNKGEAYVKNYARFYDVYSTVIVFAAVHWDENGKINFGDKGENNFAAEISALKEIIANRSNQNHKVKLIITALADGAWGNGVNEYMGRYWEEIANQIVDLTNKYGFDGVDIDWEYPAAAADWQVFDSFIQKLDKDLSEYKEDIVISAALSAGQLGLSQKTFDCIDQIQFMAYDDNDTDGYQSSLQQAQEGLRDFINNGADISKINIGIAAYGRPINSTPYWAKWRDLKDANYWNSKYYTVEDSNQIYEGTFCSPALAGDKTAYALLSGAGGIMVFRTACDKTMDNPNSVACGIENTLHRYIENW